MCVSWFYRFESRFFSNYINTSSGDKTRNRQRRKFTNPVHLIDACFPPYGGPFLSQLPWWGESHCFLSDARFADFTPPTSGKPKANDKLSSGAGRRYACRLLPSTPRVPAIFMPPRAIIFFGVFFNAATAHKVTTACYFWKNKCRLYAKALCAKKSSPVTRNDSRTAQKF